MTTINASDRRAASPACEDGQERRLTIAEALRPVDDTHVCVARRKDSPCILTFRNEDGVWRLIGFEGDPKVLKTPKHF